MHVLHMRVTLPTGTIRTYENDRSTFKPGQINVQYKDNRLIKLAQFVYLLKTFSSCVWAYNAITRLEILYETNESTYRARRWAQQILYRGFADCINLLFGNYTFIETLHNGAQLKAIQARLHGEYEFYTQCTELPVTSLKKLVKQQKFVHK